MLNKNSLFSLIELLVVIAVLMIMTSVLTPSLKRAITESHRLKCSHNNKAIGVSLMSLVEDGPEPDRRGGVLDIGPGYLPLNWTRSKSRGSLWWFDQVNDYMKLDPLSTRLNQNFYCPSDLLTESIEANWRNISYGYNFYYMGMNSSNPPNTIYKTTQLFNISLPSKTFILGDSSDDKIKSGELMASDHPWVLAWGKHLRVGDRHHNGANGLFADGHVEWNAYEDLNQDLFKDEK